MSKIKCLVVTPERRCSKNGRSSSCLQLYDGEIGIGAGHTPLIGRLGYGEMRLTDRRRSEALLRRRRVCASCRERRLGPDAPGDAGRQSRRRRRPGAIERSPARTPTTPEALEIRDRQLAQARAQLRLAESLTRG